MKVNKILVMLLVIVCVLCICMPSAFGDGVDDVISGMKNVHTVESTGGGIAKVINAVIKLIQVAGTGISLIMVTMLGIKYMIASSNEKAEIKKMAIPIIIGCILLFAATNIVGIIASFGDGLNN